MKFFHGMGHHSFVADGLTGEIPNCHSSPFLYKSGQKPQRSKRTLERAGCFIFKSVGILKDPCMQSDELIFRLAYIWNISCSLSRRLTFFTYICQNRIILELSITQTHFLSTLLQSIAFVHSSTLCVHIGILAEKLK